MQLSLEPVAGDKKKFEYVLRPAGESYPDWRSVPLDRVGAQIVVTDYASPKQGTLAGHMLAKNLEALADATQCVGGPQRWPVQEINIFDIPSELRDIAAIIVANSPVCHKGLMGSVSFKQNAFYSMCWHTGADVAVVMTFSRSTCTCLEWWTDSRETSGRILMVTPAWFDTYRPRLWFSNALAPLADAADTMAAVFLPAKLIPGICWIKGKMDVAASIVNWIAFQPKKTIVTLGTYTAELEVDLLGALRRNR